MDSGQTGFPRANVDEEDPLGFHPEAGYSTRNGNGGIEMRKQLLILTLCFAVSLSGSLAQAGGKDKLPKLTGGGVTQNNNSGGPPQLSIGGFTARATGPGIAGVYPARGQLQAKSVLTADPSTTVASIHATVVCIANLGAIGLVHGGLAGNDVWEIRFQVTHSSPSALVQVPVGVYASGFLQDNGKVDFGDENFEPTRFEDPACGGTTSFGLEAHLAGNLKVHD